MILKVKNRFNEQDIDIDMRNGGHEQADWRDIVRCAVLAFVVGFGAVVAVLVIAVISINDFKVNVTRAQAHVEVGHSLLKQDR